MRLLGLPRGCLYTTAGHRPGFGIRLGFQHIDSQGYRKGNSGRADYVVDICDPNSRQIEFHFSCQKGSACHITDLWFSEAGAQTGFVHLVSNATERETGTFTCLYQTNHKYRALRSHHDSTTLPIGRIYPNGSDSLAAPADAGGSESLGFVFDLGTDIGFTDIILALHRRILNIGIRLMEGPLNTGGTLINRPELGLSTSPESVISLQQGPDPGSCRFY